jgi:hypothetical protein
MLLISVFMVFHFMYFTHLHMYSFMYFTHLHMFCTHTCTPSRTLARILSVSHVIYFTHTLYIRARLPIFTHDLPYAHNHACTHTYFLYMCALLYNIYAHHIIIILLISIYVFHPFTYVFHFMYFTHLHMLLSRMTYLMHASMHAYIIFALLY